MPHIPQKTDVFIVGGGPAGLASALALQSRGFHVTVADSALPPIDKTCGEGLMPDAVEALSRLGVTLDPRDVFPFRGIRFLGDGAAVDSSRDSSQGDSVDASFPIGTGLGIRRTHLHQALIDRAGQAGATLLWGTRVTGLHEDGVTLDMGAVTCRWVIGADGENSRVRRWAGLNPPGRASRRFGFRRHYQVEPWSDCVEISLGAVYQIYVTPIGGGEICVVAISRDSHLRLDGALQPFPALFERLRGAPITANERGAISATRKLPRVYRDRVVLVGDASGSVDAITGEGLRLGFEQSVALAEALAGENPAAYAAAHRRLARRPAFMAGLMLMMDRSGWLRRRTLQALAAEPRIFATQLAMHIGAASPRDFVWRSMLPLGRHILTA